MHIPFGVKAGAHGDEIGLMFNIGDYLCRGRFVTLTLRDRIRPPQHLP